MGAKLRAQAVGIVTHKQKQFKTRSRSVSLAAVLSVQPCSDRILAGHYSLGTAGR